MCVAGNNVTNGVVRKIVSPRTNDEMRDILALLTRSRRGWGGVQAPAT